MSKTLSPHTHPSCYPGELFKIISAILAANGVILFEEKPSLNYILNNTGFHIASVVSCLFAYGAISLVIWITKKLDQDFPWYRGYQKRFFLQVLCGVLLPVFPLFVGAAIYFKWYDIHIFDTVYMRRYIPLICLLLLVLNAYLHYCWEKKSKARKTPKSQLVNHQPGLSLQLPAEEIAYIFAENKNCYVVNFYGEKTGWNLTLDTSMALLQEQHFYRIHRGIIVNFSAIVDTQIMDKTTSILLVAPVAKVAGLLDALPPIKTEFTVSSRENAGFKRAYSQFIRRKQEN